MVSGAGLGAGWECGCRRGCERVSRMLLCQKFGDSGSFLLGKSPIHGSVKRLLSGAVQGVQHRRRVML